MFSQLLLFSAACLAGVSAAGATPHTTYLWHMHQPIYWPDKSTWEGDRYERAYETITLGHSLNDVFTIFAKPDRVAAYQWSPRDAVSSILDLPFAGAQVSFAAALIENVASLADAGWNGGVYEIDWFHWYREAMEWNDGGGFPRMNLVLVGAHHAVSPLMDDNALRMELRVMKEARHLAWGAPAPSTRGFFPAEMCFSERMIPTLVAEAVDWVVVADVHIARACADYPSAANLDNCDPPNLSDQMNPAQGFYYAQTISRGITTRVPPFAFRPHHAEFTDPETGEVSRILVVPAAMAMSWNEGYGSYGTGEIDAIASLEDPAHPFLFLLAHDGDNAWSGGNSYYYESVSNFSHAAAAQGYEPTTIERYLADHPVDPADVVHVEDGGWVNADGDFGSPQYINWNWPLVDAQGNFDIPDGWAEDERNWAVLTAAQNRVETAEAIGGVADAACVFDPTTAGATDVEKAWHFLLAGYESGYMYYGTALDMEVKATLACNQAVALADPVIASGPDTVSPSVWLPQRLPWNPGAFGGGSLWGYPGGQGAPMERDFHVWTFVHDVSGLQSVELRYRFDLDGANPLGNHENETYAGGPSVGSWQGVAMNARVFPAGDVFNLPDVDFPVLPAHIADEYWILLEGLENVLVDYYVEATDNLGHVKRSPIQHVWVGDGSASGNGPVTWTPEEPEAGGEVTITYDLTLGALPPATDPVLIHIGHSGWQNVLSPDPAMTSGGDGTWSYTYAIPAVATSVDFVFADGLGSWDNNGGADWHVPVSGGSPGYAMDGALDAGAQAVASAAGYTLHAAWSGSELYVATDPVSASAGRDHFLFVAAGLAGTGPAPWAKSGTVDGSGFFLGNEDSNNWAGWFGFGGEPGPGGAARAAAGTVLEGTLDLVTLLGTPLPAQVHLAVGHYGTNDGEPLATQIPAGDGDGDLEAAEWVAFDLTSSTGAPAPATGPALRLDARPNPFRAAAHLRLTLPRAADVTLEVVDVRGRRVATLLERRAPAGPLEITWDGLDSEGSPVAPGVYWIRGRAGAESTARRIVKLP